MKRAGGNGRFSFTGAGGVSEHYLFIRPEAEGNIGTQLKSVEGRYAAALGALGLTPDTAVFRRIFLSDYASQAGAVRGSGLCQRPGEPPVSVSLVQQPPLPGGKLALLAYHVRAREPLVRRRLSENHVVVRRGGLRHLWSTGLRAGARALSAEEQTKSVFGGLARALEGEGGNLRDHCVRTWIYINDVDTFYKPMVDARRELFLRQGLTADTHYIASTGIQGLCGGPEALVALDAYSILGLRQRQVSYLNDLERLCPAKDYQVTFERGTRIAYADRAHCFISGTASIDSAGNILHPGDVLRQLKRAIENVEALLKAGQAALADLAYLIVYLRNAEDFRLAEGYLAGAFPGLPLAIVHGPVCRPGWLVEVEGVAVTGEDRPALPQF